MRRDGAGMDRMLCFDRTMQSKGRDSSMQEIQGLIQCRRVTAAELPACVGQTVQIHGMVHKIRRMRGFAFVLLRGMEIATGGERICGSAEQAAKMRARGMDPARYEKYLQTHRFGLPPHGGLGLGLERLTARLLELPNVRQATLFPRDCHRLEP